MTEPNVLSAESVSTAQVWSAPSLEGGVSGSSLRWRTVGEMQALEQSAHEQAQAEGRAQGLAAAQPEIDARLRALDAQARTLDAALQSLARPLALMNTQVQEQLTELAIAIARQLLRRELQTDPSQVIAVVRETVALLPAAARDVRVLLHPEDAALLRERLVAPQAESAWTLLEDPMMSRGGCRVTAEAAQIDARVETRLAAVASALLGDEAEPPL